MDLIFPIFTILQSLAISIGIGCSTFGVVYLLRAGGSSNEFTRVRNITDLLLRVALALTLLSTLASGFLLYVGFRNEYFSTHTLLVLTYLIFLVTNATFRYLDFLPHFVSSGIRIATWYALGITIALPITVTLTYSYTTLLVWYLAFTGIVILAMTLYLENKKLGV